jgi:GT2 family glycosyltransferase
MPGVSVIIPCYNGGRFLDGLLENLSSQTFDDFEIVIVNDGSSDADTCSTLATLPPSIRVVNQPNLGLPAARNAGIRAARADLVLPLDCDDRLEPSFLAATVAALRAAPDDVAFAFAHQRLTGGLDGVLTCFCDPFGQLFRNRIPYCCLMRKTAWEAVGGYDESMRTGYEDWEFNIRLICRAGMGAIEIPSPLFVYYVSADGMLFTNHSASLHGALWRSIREKHADLYRPGALLRRWWAGRSASGVPSLLRAMVLLALAKILPQAAFGALFYRMLAAAHRCRFGAASSPPHSNSPPHVRYAAPDTFAK